MDYLAKRERVFDLGEKFLRSHALHSVALGSTDKPLIAFLDQFKPLLVVRVYHALDVFEGNLLLLQTWDCQQSGDWHEAVRPDG